MEKRPIKFSYEVVEDKFYAGEYPRDKDDVASLTKIGQFVDFGITDFIDLTEDGELAPYAQFLPEGIGHYRFPLPDVTAPKTFEQLHNILTTIDRLLNSGRKVYVHCFGGIDRTGVIVACWFAYCGLSAEQAFTEYKKRWATNPKAERPEFKLHRRDPLIFHRKEYIREYGDWLKNKRCVME
jgi:protein-tyrosine phosphatase